MKPVTLFPVQSLIRVAVVVGLLLLIPVFGNHFITGWVWTLGDFIIMGALLFLTGLAIDYARRAIINPGYRALTIAAILALLFLIWVNLATGVGERVLERLVCGGSC